MGKMVTKVLSTIATDAVPALAGVLALPLATSAQTTDVARGETITGTIASVQNVNHLFVADDRGYTDDVTLRPGASVFSNGREGPF
jgi:hypothetical protein